MERANVSGAERCECRLAGLADRIERRAQIPPEYAQASFDNFVVPGPDNPILRRNLTKVVLAVRTFVREFPSGPRLGLLLIGDWGAGKTHLAVAALREMMRKTGMQGLFYNYTNLLHSIRMGYDETANLSDRDAYRSALDAEILLLDDLGAHRPGEWVEDTINSIIGYRCDNRMPLIATTNCPDIDAEEGASKRTATLPEGRERNNLLQDKKYNLVRSLGESIGARARSRLFEMCTIVNAGGVPDYRVLQKHRI